MRQTVACFESLPVVYSYALISLWVYCVGARIKTKTIMVFDKTDLTGLAKIRNSEVTCWFFKSWTVSSNTHDNICNLSWVNISNYDKFCIKCLGTIFQILMLWIKQKGLLNNLFVLGRTCFHLFIMLFICLISAMSYIFIYY